MTLTAPVETPTAPAGARQQRKSLNTLTGMRFLAALSVFFFHITILADTLPYGIDLIHIFEDASARDTYVSLFGAIGFTGVSFFFVLSGFVLAWAQRPTDTVTQFWRRRFFKIYPLHLVTYLIGLVVLTGWKFEGGPGSPDIPGFFLVQAWIPDVRTLLGANAVSWSISTEAFFYALFPLVFPLLMKVRLDRVKWWIVGLLAFRVAWAVLTDLTMSETDPYAYWFNYEFPLPRVSEFFIGVLIARLVVAGRWRNPGMLPSVALLVVGEVIALKVPLAYAQAPATIIPVMMVIAAGAASDMKGRKSFLSGRLMVWLGEISFAFYLIHLIVLIGVRKLLGPENSFSVPGALGYLAVCLAVTVVLAALLHRYVEQPVMRRWSRPSPHKPATISASLPR
ncbi:acyltransferase family protein [Streptomyces monticola]|uniref:Acyltransferase family protein n=1 Tax=Streptomyces monticola TaxID=2666263 RepID=A0ABW2JY70_9ACTN